LDFDLYNVSLVGSSNLVPFYFMMQSSRPLHGLVAATHTPFDSSGELNLDAIEKQAEHLARNQIGFAFIGGTTGECHSLSLSERMALAQRWMDVTKGCSVGVVVHVGANCLHDCKAMAAQAQSLGAVAVAALSPSYFKPSSIDTLVASMAQVAASCRQLPFYFYDIPSMTNVHLSMPQFMHRAKEVIPNLVGLKFTNTDLVSYQQLLHDNDGAWDVPFGCDEVLLAAWVMGAKGAVGSTYNFAASIYHRLIEYYQRGDLAAAREEQYRSVQLVKILNDIGYVGSAKELMTMLGVPVGPPRLPCSSLSEEGKRKLRSSLESVGFFDWI
jgi:N-acetylneuraminate lyase